jgi:multiple sugar transport system permease protein
MMKMKKQRQKHETVKWIGASVKYLLFALMIITWAFPVIWVIFTSFKERTDIFTLPPKIFFNPTVEHYIEAFLRTGDITRGTLNSILIATATTILTLLVAVPAGYAFSRVTFRFRSQLSFFALISQMAPPIGLIIPYFFILSRTRMLDSYTGLIAIHMTLTVPFSIWLMITYFQDLPVSLEESAAIDGASPFTAFFRVVLPTAWGGVGVTAIFAFIESWNEFLYAVVLNGSRTKTVPVAIFSFLTTE